MKKESKTMTSVNFCYWLQGLFELGSPEALTAEQTEQIKRHLALVFKYEIDPQMGDENIQKALNEIHSPPTALTLTCGLEPEKNRPVTITSPFDLDRDWNRKMRC